MGHDGDAVLIEDLVFEGPYFPSKVLPIKHGDGLKVFFSIRRGLIFLQLFRALAKGFSFIFAQCFLLFLKLLKKCLFPFRGKAGMRLQNKYRTMKIVEEIFLCDLLKIARIKFLTKCPEGFYSVEKVKRPHVVIEPGIKHRKAVDESFRIRTKIRLSEPEFRNIEGSLQCFSVYPFFDLFFEHVFHYRQKPVKMLFIRAFQFYRKCGLKCRGIKASHNICGYACL